MQESLDRTGKTWEPAGGGSDYKVWKCGTVSMNVFSGDTGVYVKIPVSPVLSGYSERLYAHLTRSQDKTLRIAELHFDPQASDTLSYIGSGGSVHGAATRLFGAIEKAMTDLARQVKDDPTNPIADFDFIIGVTRLATQGKVVDGRRFPGRLEQMGFHIFDISGDRFASMSHGLAARSYEHAYRGDKDASKREVAAQKPYRRPARFMVVSKEELLERAGK